MSSSVQPVGSAGGPGHDPGSVDPAAKPGISWTQLDMAQASKAAHIHTVFTVRSPEGR